MNHEHHEVIASRTVVVGGLTAVVGLALSFAVSGCNGGADGPPLVGVSGEVVLDGVPVKHGVIVFESADGKTRSYGGTIEDGEFSFDSTAGAKRVRIEAYRDVHDARVLGPDGVSMTAGSEQYVPDTYNARSSLESVVELEGDGEFFYKLRTES